MSMKTESRERYPVLSLAYAQLLPRLKLIANEHGYALAIHGSMTTDMDIILVPWTDEAASANVVVEALRVEVQGQGGKHFPNPEAKPHGRMAWSFYFDDFSARQSSGPYLDISVMPKVRARNR